MRRTGNLKRILTKAVLIAVGLATIGLGSYRLAAADREVLNRSLACPVNGHFVSGADVQMFVQEDGPSNGSAILFVHGSGTWSEIWRHSMDTLAARGFHVVAVDMPPFGFSERPSNADYRDETQARRILAVVEALHLTQITLVGHAFGARHAMEAFFLDSSRFSRLVLVDADLGLSTERSTSPQFGLRTLLALRPLRNALVSATLTNPSFTGRLLRRVVADQSVATRERVTMLQRPLSVQHTTVDFGAWLRPYMLNHERSSAMLGPLYESISVPTLVVWGEFDAVIPVNQGRDLAKLIPSASFVELPGVGHIPTLEAPEKFDAALLGFVAPSSTASTTALSQATPPAQQKRRR